MKIAILASGNGTNAQQIIEYFSKKTSATVELIASNKPDAYVLQRAKKLGVPTFVFSNQQLREDTILLDELKAYKIEFIVLVGFLLKLPNYLINAFPDKIINIHPALLPKYGGKGMYGRYVHEAVIKAKEKTSGITIHYVNKNYDEGAIIFQSECDVAPDETPESLAEKIHLLECAFFPRVIEKIILKKEISFTQSL